MPGHGRTRAGGGPPEGPTGVARRYHEEIAGARRAARQLRVLSAIYVLVGVLASAAIVVLMATGHLSVTEWLGWLALTLFSVVLGGVGGYVAAFSLILSAARLEASLAPGAERR